jgi:DNA-directed RNA polymerase specialized sigma24 family protein
MVDADVDARVFEDVFRDEYPRLVPMLHVLTGDRHRAKDLAQEALFRAQRDWHRISTYDRPGAPASACRRSTPRAAQPGRPLLPPAPNAACCRSRR